MYSTRSWEVGVTSITRLTAHGRRGGARRPVSGLADSFVIATARRCRVTRVFTSRSAAPPVTAGRRRRRRLRPATSAQWRAGEALSWTFHTASTEQGRHAVSDPSHPPAVTSLNAWYSVVR